MRWLPLQRGDRIDIIAPASHAPQENLDQGRDWLISLGLIPRIPLDLISPDVFFASTLESQVEHLKEALYSNSKAIWCLRGGYGSMRLIPYLNKWKAPKKPKLLIGFSDITSLHLFLNQTWNWPTLHARVLSQMTQDTQKLPDVREIEKILFGKIRSKTFKNLTPLNQAAKEIRTLSGKILGGNFRIIQSSLGTDWELKAKGKIVFLEDVAERGYSVDRMFEQLIQAKMIHKGLKAMIIGDFTGGHEKDGTNLINVALRRFAERVEYPVIMGLPCGHDPHKNFALPFNTKVEILTGKKVSMTCEFAN